jgi:tetratricopeptide (TPR) repeat protein
VKESCAEEGDYVCVGLESEKEARALAANKRYPEAVRAYLAASVQFARVGKFDEAGSLIDKAAQLSKLAPTDRNRAELALQTGMLCAAQAHRDPKPIPNPDRRKNLSCAVEQLRQAVDLFQRLHILKQAAAGINLGHNLSLLDLDSEAITMLQTAVEWDKDDPETVAYVAHALADIQVKQKQD